MNAGLLGIPKKLKQTSTVTIYRSTSTNPISGPFGLGLYQVFYTNGTFTTPSTVTSAGIRVRCWGAGGGGCDSISVNNTGGGGGGFCLKVITSPAASYTVTVQNSQTNANTTGGTSSFGSVCSATGGQSGIYLTLGGSGIGGDINYIGGQSYGTGTSNGGSGGGGVANIFGNGGNGGDLTYWGGGNGFNGASGGGGGGTNMPTGISATGGAGGNGIFGKGGIGSRGVDSTVVSLSTPGKGVYVNGMSIDFIGCGGGGGGGLAFTNATSSNGTNGGGGGGAGGYSGYGTSSVGGFPGGGGGGNYNNGTYCQGGAGLIIVEW